ncbi:MAG: glycosyltransferase [Solirubrobacterales bacterium]|nr:glycosyltransferase [Solirubrobacterales bacterium]
MTVRSRRFAFFGSSLISAYWNGACTYYRGLVRALHARGHRITFYEPRAYERQEHRDIDDPAWARIVVYEPTDAAAVRSVVARARGADVIVKCSGVGVFDDVLEAAVADLDGPAMRIFWDVDAPATLTAMESGELAGLRSRIADYDLVLTYGGGRPVVDRYRALGARRCDAVYNALDPATHHPVPGRRDLACDLVFLGNRLPDRERRVDDLFFGAVARAPASRFVLGGNGWGDRVRSPNLRYLGHVSPADHNAVNCSARAVLNVTRDSMAANGFSPPTRVFEAAGAGACLITDAWEGIDQFLAADEEVLVARDGREVAGLVAELDPRRAAEIGAAARRRILGAHTYAHRAAQVEAILAEQEVAVS